MKTTETVKVYELLNKGKEHEGFYLTREDAFNALRTCNLYMPCVVESYLPLDEYMRYVEEEAYEEDIERNSPWYLYNDDCADYDDYDPTDYA